MMIENVLSLSSSITYWYLDNYTKHSNTKILFKFMAIMFLTNWSHIYYSSILTFYAIGDVVINYSEERSVIFFGIGHILFIFHMLSSRMVVELVIGSFFINISTNLFMDILDKNGMVYYCYIYILHLALIVPMVNGYYGQLLFILSDLLIGIGLEETKKVEWVLYYVSILYMYNYWFDVEEINVLE